MRRRFGDLAEALLSVAPVMLCVTILQLGLRFLSAEEFLRHVLGVGFASLGMWLFLRGVNLGLLPLAEAVGGELPKRLGLASLLVLAFAMGAVVSGADPSLRILAELAEDAMRGSAARPGLLMLSISLGIGLFLCLAALHLVLRVSLGKLLAACYGLVLALCLFAPRDFTPLAFDAGGLATGPLTEPFLVSFGIGFATVLGHGSPSKGFGFLGLTTLGPILAVMVLGMLR